MGDNIPGGIVAAASKFSFPHKVVNFSVVAHEHLSL